MSMMRFAAHFASGDVDQASKFKFKMTNVLDEIIRGLGHDC